MVGGTATVWGVGEVDTGSEVGDVGALRDDQPHHSAGYAWQCCSVQWYPGTWATLP